MRYLLYSWAGAGQNFIELSKLIGRSQEMNFYLNRRAYHTPLEKYKEWMPFLRAIFAPAAAAASSVAVSQIEIEKPGRGECAAVMARPTARVVLQCLLSFNG